MDKRDDETLNWVAVTNALETILEENWGVEPETIASTFENEVAAVKKADVRDPEKDDGAPSFFVVLENGESFTTFAGVELNTTSVCNVRYDHA